MPQNLDTSQIKEWRSIVTLIVFVLTNIVVLFPFHIPIYVPRPLSNAFLDGLSALRIISPRQDRTQECSQDCSPHEHTYNQQGNVRPFVRLNFPMNFVTAPLIADLFLLAIVAIGRQEVHDGTVGSDNISPLDIMIFFLTLAYIAISIDASGLIRYLAFKVLQKGGKAGPRLFFYLYAFFFALGSFIGNDPIILSGTAFLAYMTRVSSNIIHPRAWIHTQFAVANIASAVLVSSNPTNLVLAGAFNIKFIVYTANIIVPVLVTAIILFPFLLYIVFADEDKSLIPDTIKMHELSEEARAKTPVNPNIPHARGTAKEEENELANDEQGKLLSLEEIMNPFLDKGGAAFGAVLMATTLITLLVLNAVSQSSGEHPVFWVTLPAAFVMFCWDVAFGFLHRTETRTIARNGRDEVERARAERVIREEDEGEAKQATLGQESSHQDATLKEMQPSDSHMLEEDDIAIEDYEKSAQAKFASDTGALGTVARLQCLPFSALNTSSENNDDQMSQQTLAPRDVHSKSCQPDAINVVDTLDEKHATKHGQSSPPPADPLCSTSTGDMYDTKRMHDERILRQMELQHHRGQPTLVSFLKDWYRWSQETFPTVTAVVAHLPFALLPFALAMFVLVQALVTKGWVPVFAYGWTAWVNKTGTIGAIAGMGFLSVILCNFAGTNIGTTILLSRVVQAWQQINDDRGTTITDRTFWATVYSIAIGVNFGAFSIAFSASLAGLLWRDILARKHIHVHSLDFARVNLPIIAAAMAIGCAVLVGEVYIFRDNSPYNS